MRNATGPEGPDPALTVPVDLLTERDALNAARDAARAKLDKLATVSGGGIDKFSDEFIAAVVAHTIRQLQQELVVFGRVDDDRAWRIGIVGVDDGTDQLVVDWRARFAGAFYQATMDEPMGLRRRVSYVGCIDDLMVEDLVDGGISGTSPLMAELSRRRGDEMRAAVATLQADQDRLVRLDPAARLVLRGGPGTGKTVVALHRAAWLVYNDRRITSDRLLVLGPSDRFLRFVSTVLPTLGEARIHQSTFDRLLGPATEPGTDPAWLGVLDRFEEGLVQPRSVRLGGRRLGEEEVTDLAWRAHGLALPWRDRRKVFLSRMAALAGVSVGEATAVAGDMLPACTPAAAWKRLRRRATLAGLGMDTELIDAWLAVDDDGPLRDEVATRFAGVETRFAHVIVDEAQDLTALQLRAVQRRSEGLTLVGDDAQRSAVGSLGLAEVARRLDAPLEEMAVAYRMSAEIAEWCNRHALAHGLEAVQLVGIRPTGVDVVENPTLSPGDGERLLARRWGTVASIRAGRVWEHKGVEYDGVVVDRTAMTPSEVYLAASRAAHELIVVG